MHDLKDQIKRLTKGKSTNLKIGSRSVAHRLNNKEREKFELALRLGYLTFNSSFRSSLKNSFTDYKMSEGFEPIILENNINFPVEYNLVLLRINSIDPIEYSKTRNYLSGYVTQLSPYITRGVISVKQIWDNLISMYPNLNYESQIFKELAWREYFLRVRENFGDKIFESFNKIEEKVTIKDISKSLIEAKTGIIILDKEINNLLNNGYIHNHSRMWIASVVTNISETYWEAGAKWMYYYLLDGELASNYLSWQWVGGSLNNKQYYANQDNINQFSASFQKDTFLDYSYEKLPFLDIPEVLKDRVPVVYKNQVRQIKSSNYKREENTLLYSPWNLDPNWYLDDNSFQRILLLEPSHFDKYPVSSNVLSFIIKLSKQIKGLKIVIKDYNDLDINPKLLIAKSHINTKHWKVNQLEVQGYLFPEISDYYKSFFSYWKECVKTIEK